MTSNNSHPDPQPNVESFAVGDTISRAQYESLLRQHVELGFENQRLQGHVKECKERLRELEHQVEVAQRLCAILIFESDVN